VRQTHASQTASRIWRLPVRDRLAEAAASPADSRQRGSGVTEQAARTRVPFVDLRRQHAPLRTEILRAFDRVLGASAFILGEEVELFEAAFAEYCEARHCVGVNSGTAALTITLLAAGVGPGDEVIVPAHTFIATALAVVHAGATPVCADVEQATGLLDPASAAAAIGPRTAAILPVHLYGQVCAMDELRALATRHSLALFEDAAQAHGATHRGARAGTLGQAAAFSFYPSKNLGAVGDGGAIVTNDGELAARCTAAARSRPSRGLPASHRRVQRAPRRLASRCTSDQARPLGRMECHLDAYRNLGRVHGGDRIVAKQRKALDDPE